MAETTKLTLEIYYYYNTLIKWKKKKSVCLYLEKQQIKTWLDKMIIKKIYRDHI